MRANEQQEKCGNEEEKAVGLQDCHGNTALSKKSHAKRTEKYKGQKRLGWAEIAGKKEEVKTKDVKERLQTESKERCVSATK